MQIDAQNDERAILLVEFLQTQPRSRFVEDLGAADAGAAAQHFVERAHRGESAMPVLPEAGADADVAKLLGALVYAHAPSMPRERRRRGEAADSGASDLGMSATRH